jgi:hypothetical protein
LIINPDARSELDLLKPKYISGFVEWNENISFNVGTDHVKLVTSHKTSNKTSHGGTSIENSDIEDRNLEKVLNRSNEIIENNSTVVSVVSPDKVLEEPSDEIADESSDEIFDEISNETLTTCNSSGSYFNLCFHDLSGSEVDFMYKYSKFSPHPVFEIKHYIDQSFSKFFHPNIVCMLIYGMALNVVGVVLQNDLPNEWVLRLYFLNEEDLKRAENIFSQMTGLKQLLTSPYTLSLKRKLYKDVGFKKDITIIGFPIKRKKENEIEEEDEEEYDESDEKYEKPSRKRRN